MLPAHDPAKNNPPGAIPEPAGGMPAWEKMTRPSPRVEQALIERKWFLAWCPVRRSHMELMSLESDPRWPVFVEKVKSAAQAGASATI